MTFNKTPSNTSNRNSKKSNSKAQFQKNNMQSVILKNLSYDFSLNDSLT